MFKQDDFNAYFGRQLKNTIMIKRLGDYMADIRCELKLVSKHASMVTVGVKTGGSQVGVLNCASRPDGNRRQGTQSFTQVRALSMEVKPYVLLD